MALDLTVVCKVEHNPEQPKQIPLHEMRRGLKLLSTSSNTRECGNAYPPEGSNDTENSVAYSGYQCPFSLWTKRRANQAIKEEAGLLMESRS
jgi:hypothetical protein